MSRPFFVDLAEGEGFEPSTGFPVPAFQASALGQLCDPSRLWESPLLPAAERVGFEPTEAQHLTAFRERHLQPLGHLSIVPPVILAK